MSEQDTPQAREILKEIRAAERSVEAMFRQAEREAAGILERARAEAGALVAEKRRVLEQKQSMALRNPGFLRPFETLTRVVALPRYGSIDPTPYVAVFSPCSTA